MNNIRCSKLQGVLDEDVIKIFAPFRFIQRILGSCRINVRGGIVTAPTVVQKCYTIICMVTSMYMGAKFVKSYSDFYTDTVLLYIFMIGVTSLSITFNVSTFHTTFLNNEENVKLYNIMQKIDNVLKLHSKHTIRSSHYKHDVLVVLGFMIIYTIHFITVVLLTQNHFGIIEQIGSLWAFYAFVYELSCCSSHILFFTNRVRVVNSMIIDHFKSGVGDIATLSERCTKIELKDFESRETDVYMKEILNGFSCFHDQYRFQVFLFCTLFISYMVVTFQYIILVLQRTEFIDKRALILDFVYMGTMGNTNVNMLIWICIRIEAFFREVRKTKKLSIIVLSRYTEGPLRQKAKRMFKLIDETPPSFPVYGMWLVDARLLLGMFQIVTSTYVILLQFAFS